MCVVWYWPKNDIFKNHGIHLSSCFQSTHLPWKACSYLLQRGLKLIFLTVSVFKRFIGSKREKRTPPKNGLLVPPSWACSSHIGLRRNEPSHIWRSIVTEAELCGFKSVYCEIYYVNRWQYPTLSLYHAGISQEKGWNVLCFEDSSHKVLFVQTLELWISIPTCIANQIEPLPRIKP